MARSGEHLIVPDARADERYFEDVDRQTGLELRSILTIPLRAKGKVIGVLQAVDTAVARFSPTDLELLEPLTASAAAAIENARLAKEASEVKILQELNHLRSELIANVSHELRTPLGLIKIFCTSLLMDDIDVDPQTRAKFLRGIDEETEKLEAIVDNLLDLSQMESERLHLERQSTDLAQLAEERTPLGKRYELAELAEEFSTSLRAELDSRLDQAGYQHVRIVVSGGIDPPRIRLFRERGAPIDAFGIGSAISSAPPIDFTGDIKAIEGKPIAKRGRIPGITPIRG